MTAMERLAALGFTNCSLVDEKKRNGEIVSVTVKIMTDKGWTYDRFANSADVDTWAVGKAPA